MTKRKDRRRELLKEDEFLTMMERWVRYAQDHSRVVIATALGLIVVLALGFGWLNWMHRKRDQAAQALYAAEKVLQTDVSEDGSDYATEREKNEAAIAMLDDLITGQSGVVADQARLKKISCLVNLGREDEAIAIYRELSERDNLIGLFAMIGMGDYQFGQDAYDQALEAYSNVLSRKDGRDLFEDLVKLKMARCHKAKGDLQSAREQLEEVVAKYDSEQSKRVPILQKVESLLAEVEQEISQGSASGAS